MKRGTETKYGHLHAICLPCAGRQIGITGAAEVCCNCSRQIIAGAPRTYSEDVACDCGLETYEILKAENRLKNAEVSL